jgi:hypothetical protein
VLVSGTAHRGVSIYFDELAKLVLDHDLVHPHFRMADGAIVW